MSVQLLEHNLRSITIAADTQKSVVANYKGTHIYTVSTFRGKVWSIFYCFASLLGKKTLKQQKLAAALQGTQKIFQTNLLLVQKSIDRYQDDLLCALSCGDKVDARDFVTDRALIVEWNAATSHFLKPHYDANKKLRDLFKNSFQIDVSQKDPFPFTGATLLECRRLRNIIHGERLLETNSSNIESTMPLRQFRRLCDMDQNGTLDQKDEAILKNWITIAQKIRLKDLHNFLMGIVDVIYSTEGNVRKTGMLENRLLERGLTRLYDINMPHSNFKKGLVSGNTVLLNEKTVTLGKKLSKSQDFDEQLVFEDRDDADSVIVFGANQASLGMQMMKATESNKIPLEVVVCTEVDSKGICGRMVRLKNPLSEIAWTSKDTLSKEDEANCRLFISYFKYWIGCKMSFKPFTAEQFMYDVSGNVVSNKIVKEVEINFNDYEKIFWDIAHGNHIVFQHLMTTCELYSDHSLFQFYRSVVREEYGTVEKAAEMYSLKDRFKANYDEIITKAQQLKRNIDEIVQECEPKYKEKMKGKQSPLNDMKHVVQVVYDFFRFSSIIDKQAILDKIEKIDFLRN